MVGRTVAFALAAAGCQTTTVSQLCAGDPAPVLSLPDDNGAPFDLVSLRGRKVIVYFFPAAMTPGCSTQAQDFRDTLGSLQEAGYEVVGVSPDPSAALADFVAHEQLTFRLLSDPDLGTITRWGAHGERTLYGRQVVGVIRSTVVVDEQGLVTLARYNVKATGHVSMLRRLLGIG